ncbi:MAG: tetratricopeptide repeat protein, partial [Candidatus Obscuribacterales bacterium]|nr:tetratricopeptide repeat protein [Candidatus Obscuribacterales bacterium]
MSKFNLQDELVERAELCQDIGDYTGAEQFLKRALRESRRTPATDEVVLRYLVRKLADNSVRAGDFARAERYWQRLIASQRKIGDLEKHELGRTLTQAGLFYSSHQQWRQAKIRFNQALAIQEVGFGKDYPDYALTLSEMGRLYACTGKKPKAEKTFKLALALVEEQLGNWHEFVALVLRRQALAMIRWYNPENIEPMLERAIAILTDGTAMPHPELRKCLSELADLGLERGYRRRAEKLYVKSLQLTEPFLG